MKKIYKVMTGRKEKVAESFFVPFDVLDLLNTKLHCRKLKK